MALPPYEIVRQNRMMQAAQPVMTSGVPEDPLVRAQQMMAAARAAAPQGIDPRMAALLDRQLSRVGEQEQEVLREGKRTPWEALARAGAAMAQSRSPFFAPALAAGFGEFGDTVREGRLAEMRARAAAAQQRDQIEMERLRAESAGVRAAEEGLDRTVSLAGKLVDVDARMAQAQENLAKAAQIDDPQMRALELAKARAEIRAVEALSLQRRTAAEKNMREPAGGGGTAGTTAGESLSPSESEARGLDPELPWVYDKNGIPRLPVGFKAPTGQRGAVPPENVLKTIGRARALLPQASGGGISGALTRGAELFGKSTDRSKADAALRVVAGQLTASVPRFEGPQALPEVKLYQAMAADVANSELPTETRLEALKEMEKMIQRNMEYKKSRAATRAAGAISAGDVKDGYRFKGGNPADPKNWEKL